MWHPDPLRSTVHLSLGRELEVRAGEIASAIVDRQYTRHPELLKRYGPAGRGKCLRDAQYHLSYLGQAALANRPSLFSDYVEWARVMLAARLVPAADLARNLEYLDDVLRELLPITESAYATGIIKEALHLLPQNAGTEPPPCLDAGHPLAPLAAAYLEQLLAGSRHEASRLILAAVEQGVPIRDIYLHVFQRSQHEIGRLWQLNRVTVAQEHYCSAATQLIMSQLYPHIFNSVRVGRTMVAASVGGDLHEIGIRMVSDFFEIAGWDTFYLGASTPSATLLETVRERTPDVVAISATMPYHIGEVTLLISALRAAGLDSVPKLIVGGRPFSMNDGLWRDVGADATAADAADAVLVATALVEGSS